MPARQHQIAIFDPDRLPVHTGHLLSWSGCGQACGIHAEDQCTDGAPCRPLACLVTVLLLATTYGLLYSMYEGDPQTSQANQSILPAAKVDCTVPPTISPHWRGSTDDTLFCLPPGPSNQSISFSLVDRRLGG